MNSPVLKGVGESTGKKSLPRTARPYWNPYLAGIGLGVTLLAAFVIMGRGLGASGGFTTGLSSGVSVVAPAYVSSNPVLSAHLENESGNPLLDWLVFELFGVLAGAFVSGWMAHRIKLEVVRGPGIPVWGRLSLAFSGGILMGFAAKLARGCTSGQALTGGAVLSVGSWVFMISLFIGAYAVALLVRRQWT